MIPPTGTNEPDTPLNDAYHVGPKTPHFHAPGGWGPSFYPAVLPMICPRPTRCEWDAYPKTGIHLCLRVVCPYRWMTRAILRRRIDRLERCKHRTVQQERELGEARRMWVGEFGNGL